MTESRPMGSSNSSYPNSNVPSSYRRVYAEPPFDRHTFWLIEVVLVISITGAISVFGIITNSINIVIFYRQGILSHSCTVSLAGLAVSDFFFCLSNLWGSVCMILYFFVPFEDIRISANAFYIYTSIRPALFFSEITCWVTAFVAFERLFSVVFPFKVKSVFTAKRSCVVIVCIFIGSFIFNIPSNFEALPTWIFHPGYNFSILVMKPIELMQDDILPPYIYARAIIRTTIIVIVLLCNIAISWKVNVSTKFRKSTASTTTHTVSPSSQDPNSSKQDQDKQVNSKKADTDAGYNSSKEMKLVRMITAVCVLFSICYIMDVACTIVFYMTGIVRGIDYHIYTEYVLLHVTQLFQSVNSSCNIIIYYIMSTRYKEEFQMCCFDRKK